MTDDMGYLLQLHDELVDNIAFELDLREHVYDEPDDDPAQARVTAAKRVFGL